MDLTAKSTAELHALMADARAGAPEEKSDTVLIAACEEELGVRGGWIVRE
jgi:hypothetical protein